MPKTKPGYAGSQDNGDVWFKRSYNGLVAFFQSDRPRVIANDAVGISRANHSTHDVGVWTLLFRTPNMYAQGLAITCEPEECNLLDIQNAIMGANRECKGLLDRYDISCLIADYIYNLSSSAPARMYVTFQSSEWDDNKSLDDEVFYIFDAFGQYSENSGDIWAKFGPLSDLIVTMDNRVDLYGDLRGRRDLPPLMRFHSPDEWALVPFDVSDYDEIHEWMQSFRFGSPVDLRKTEFRDQFKRPNLKINVAS